MANGRYNKAHGQGGDEFENIAHRKSQTVVDWHAEMKAHAAQKRGTSGIYNPKTGEREYAGRNTLPQKSMRRGY